MTNKCFMDNSDVGDNVMLVTFLWWHLEDVGDFIDNGPLCWWLIYSVTNFWNRSPIFQSCHQHISSPTSVTNIDVALWMLWRLEFFAILVKGSTKHFLVEKNTFEMERKYLTSLRLNELHKFLWTIYRGNTAVFLNK